jgi:fumarate reductase subunit D
VLVVGYLYIIDLINAPKIEHITKNQFLTAVNITVTVLLGNYCAVHCGVVNSAMEIAAESLT